MGVIPYEVGMTDLGKSSPAYPARIEEVPMSSTKAETSSGAEQDETLIRRSTEDELRAWARLTYLLRT